MNTKSLYPLKFNSIYKDKIWGGQKIKTVMGMDFSPLINCGEAWVLSGVEGDQSVVVNGFLAENELNELVEIYMGELVGEKNYEEFGDQFPILVKIIDSNDWLSIQVHPDDELAIKRGLDRGKTEMWYLLDAEKNAEIILGFNKEIKKNDYQELLNDKKLKSVLNAEKVKAGDVFYVPAGRVHAIGPGILLAEIQQTSDTTYRIYDWDRIGVDGLMRELHIDEALDAIDFKVQKNYKTEYSVEKNKTSKVVKSKYFTTNLIDMDVPLSKDYSVLDSFVIYLCVEGSYVLLFGDERLTARKGETILIPAIMNEVKIIPAPKAKILEVYIA
ncbi:MAG: class I mannose-6-phosphate isomerase [Bacteroidetes bacterium]|nr:class I mannose-6-phosphate isomerase [Bacteroidota bacterium]